MCLEACMAKSDTSLQRYRISWSWNNTFVFVLHARVELRPLSFRIKWPDWGWGHSGWCWGRAGWWGCWCRFCVADVVDGVLGPELCSCQRLQSLGLGAPVPSIQGVAWQGNSPPTQETVSSCFFFLFGSTLGWCGFTKQMHYMKTHQGCCKTQPLANDHCLLVIHRHTYVCQLLVTSWYNTHSRSFWTIWDNSGGVCKCKLRKLEPWPSPARPGPRSCLQDSRQLRFIFLHCSHHG